MITKKNIYLLIQRTVFNSIGYKIRTKAIFSGMHAKYICKIIIWSTGIYRYMCVSGRRHVFSDKDLSLTQIP